jgi:hypothetical protein
MFVNMDGQAKLLTHNRRHLHLLAWNPLVHLPVSVWNQKGKEKHHIEIENGD